MSFCECPVEISSDKTPQGKPTTLVLLYLEESILGRATGTYRLILIALLITPYSLPCNPSYDVPSVWGSGVVELRRSTSTRILGNSEPGFAGLGVSNPVKLMI